RRGSGQRDVEEDAHEEERVHPDRDERDVEEPGGVHGMQPGALEDPEAGAEDEAAGRDDGKPDERRVPPNELETRPHQSRAIAEAACHSRSIGCVSTPMQPRKGAFERGAKTNPHDHPDSVMYALSAFRRRLTVGGQSSDVSLEHGDVRWLDAHSHTGENIGETPTHVIFVELKYR